MIGHVFADSGAVTLAVAPHATRASEYVVLAGHEGRYVVAALLVDDLPAPSGWLQGDYCLHLGQAIAFFAQLAGLPSSRHEVLRAQVLRTEDRLAREAVRPRTP